MARSGCTLVHARADTRHVHGPIVLTPIEAPQRSLQPIILPTDEPTRPTDKPHQANTRTHARAPTRKLINRCHQTHASRQPTSYPWGCQLGSRRVRFLATRGRLQVCALLDSGGGVIRNRVAWQPSRRRAQLRLAHRLATPHCGAPCGGVAAQISAMALRGPCGSAAWCGVAVSRRGVERKRTREETSVRTIEFRFGAAHGGTAFRQSPFEKRRAWVVQRQPWPIPWMFTFGMCRGVSPNTRGHRVFEPASDPFKGFSRA